MTSKYLIIFAFNAYFLTQRFERRSDSNRDTAVSQEFNATITISAGNVGHFGSSLWQQSVMRYGGTIRR